MLTLTKGLLNQYGRKIEERKRRKKKLYEIVGILHINIRNLPWLSANAKGFAKAYLCFLVSALAKKMLRQLNS